MPRVRAVPVQTAVTGSGAHGAEGVAFIGKLLEEKVNVAEVVKRLAVSACFQQMALQRAAALGKYQV